MLGYLKFLLPEVFKKVPLPPRLLFYICIAMDKVLLKDGQNLKVMYFHVG